MLEPAALSPGGRVDALVAIERQLAWLAAMQTRLLAVMVATDHSDDRWVREEVGCALRLLGLPPVRLPPCLRGFVLAGRITAMPKAFPVEFRNDVVAVARKGQAPYQPDRQGLRHFGVVPAPLAAAG